MNQPTTCCNRQFIRIMPLLFIFSLFFISTAHAQQMKDPDVIGRWDITIEKGGKSLPSWLEVQKSGTHTLIGRFTYAFGSARPISQVMVNGSKFSFSIPPQWEEGTRNMDFEFEVNGNVIKGTMVYTDGQTYNWTGVRAPLLERNKPVVWGTPIRLFDGKDTKGWHTDGTNQWIVENGILRSKHSGANLISDPGQWQSYDITLVGRMVTVVANGREVICRQIIPGITGGAINSKEGEPGPILIQGDHGPIDYRNIVITPAK
jgi:hypothetical protein